MHKVVNYAGSTVELGIGKFDIISAANVRQEIQLLDTPGLNSLLTYSKEEELTTHLLFNLSPVIGTGLKNPDLLLLVVDINQLGRQLGLLKELKSFGFSVILVLSKFDLALQRGLTFDIDILSREVNCPVIVINGRTGMGLSVLKDYLAKNLGKEADILPFDQKKLKENQSEIQNWAIQIACQVMVQKKIKKRLDLDQWALHPIWGGILFLVTMFIFFFCIFSLASPLMEGIDFLFSSLGEALKSLLPETLLSRLITEGLVSGSGAIAVFVPQIAILFLMLGALESSGYLARGAVLVDKPLSLIGLSGKSFVPLLSGCACAIPAALATRTIPSHRERLLTLFVIPLMTCSARLPVYGLLLSLLFIGRPHWMQAMALTGIYCFSILLLSLFTAIAGKLLKLEEKHGFQMELPQWQRPQWKWIFKQTYQQTLSFVKKAGPTILGISIVLWGLSNFPSGQAPIINLIGQKLSILFSPMGIDWRVGVAILLSFSAREVFVSAIAVMFTVTEGNQTHLLMTLKNASLWGSHTPLFTWPSIASLLVFFMVSMQCLSTLVVIKSESKQGWRFAVIQFVTYLVSGYGLSVLTFQILSRLGR